jgi:transposase InsO family protein
VLAPSERYYEVRGRKLKKITDWARQMVFQVRRWLPEQSSIVVGDITYVRLGTRYIYLAVILDAYSPAVRGFAVSRCLSQNLTVDALKMALARVRRLFSIPTKAHSIGPGYILICCSAIISISACLIKANPSRTASLSALCGP